MDEGGEPQRQRCQLGDTVGYGDDGGNPQLGLGVQRDPQGQDGQRENVHQTAFETGSGHRELLSLPAQIHYPLKNRVTVYRKGR